MIIIVTYRPDEVLPERIRGIIDPPQTEGISLRPPDSSVPGHADFRQSISKPQAWVSLASH
jgi:hypothetical protein